MTPKTGKQSYETGKVFLPGVTGSFEVMQNHAAIVASLKKGEIRWTDERGKLSSFAISSGVVSVEKNIVNVAAQE